MGMHIDGYIPKTLQEMLYSGTTEAEKNALRVREHREQLRRLSRNLYTDEFDRDQDEIVAEHILAIAAVLLPNWQVSHSSAATRGPVHGMLFMSGSGKPGRHLELPGLRIVRLPGLEVPEYDTVIAPTPIAPAVGAPPEPIHLRVSTPLQTVFECLSTSRKYPEKNLPEVTVTEMISRLSMADRERAERFAARNGLRRQYVRFRELSFDAVTAERTKISELDSAKIFFYGWEVGSLTYLGAGEYRFEYAPTWPFALSSQLPLGPEVSYEGRGMPSFFENCLPEGWTESVVLASNKLSREDLFGLFSTTRKYLSNLTLRPLGIPDEELVYDAHSLRLGDLRPDPDGVVRLYEELGSLPDDVGLWRRTRPDGPLRLSGVQAKLPVSLYRGSAGETIRIGDLRHACTHILKVPALHFPYLVENEWATMELARRVGLPVAQVARVEFQEASRYEGRSLLVERYDIPDRARLDSRDVPLVLQEDACALLNLRREQKYDSSLERVGDALVAAGIETSEMRAFLRLVAFSWLVGNGDLHAKNVSVLHLFRMAGPGEPPRPSGIALAPFYDLVSTRLYLTGDEFALPVDGRANNLRLKNFSRLAGRWEMGPTEVRADIERLVRGVSGQLAGVLSESGLPEDLQAKYKSIVDANIDSLGL